MDDQIELEQITDNVRIIAALRGERGIDDFTGAERDLFDEVLAMLEVSPQLAREFERIRDENAKARAP